MSKKGAFIYQQIEQTTAGIDEFLLTRKKRMALGADLNVDIFLC